MADPSPSPMKICRRKFVPGAAGNISTEDVLHLCEESDIDTGIDIIKVMELSRTLRQLLGHDADSYILRAGRSRDLIQSQQ
jgi:hydroxymethylglutaryl-CoA lyase